MRERVQPIFALGCLELACELVRNNRIGTLKEVKVFVPAGLREGPFQTVPVPNGFHWDLWLGQAPKVDYLKERTHGTFRWWWDYSGGPVTDWGAHHNDIARWAIGLEGPTAIEASAPIAPIPGGYTTPPAFEAMKGEARDLLAEANELDSTLDLENVERFRRALWGLKPEPVRPLTRAEREELCTRVRRMHAAVRGAGDQPEREEQVRRLVEAHDSPRTLIRALIDELESAWWAD